MPYCRVQDLVEVIRSSSHSTWPLYLPQEGELPLFRGRLQSQSPLPSPCQKSDGRSHLVSRTLSSASVPALKRLTESTPSRLMNPGRDISALRPPTSTTAKLKQTNDLSQPLIESTGHKAAPLQEVEMLDRHSSQFQSKEPNKLLSHSSFGLPPHSPVTPGHPAASCHFPLPAYDPPVGRGGDPHFLTQTHSPIVGIISRPTILKLLENRLGFSKDRSMRDLKQGGVSGIRKAREVLRKLDRYPLKAPTSKASTATHQLLAGELFSLSVFPSFRLGKRGSSAP